jgi:hypothetical protein
METDDGLADLFKHVAGNLDPQVNVMVDRGERLGRRLRARRRVGIAAGSTVAAAVAGVGLVAGAHHARPALASALAGADDQHRGASGSAGQHRGAIGSARPGTGRTASASPQAPKSPKATPAPGAKTDGEMTPHQMLVTLRRMLPDGSVLSHVNPYSSDRGDLEVDYNDGQGAVDLMISVFPPGTISEATCPNPLWTDEGTRPPGALPISCAMRTLPDGSVERDAVMYADSYGFYGYDIYDLRPDGVTVFIQVANGINHTLPQVDRARPPGSMAEWEAVVESPAWHV